MKHILLYILLSVSLFSCVNSDESVVYDRVLLVYLGGDNNLSSEVQEKIDALVTGWKGDETKKVIIYQDESNAAPKLSEIISKNGSKSAQTITSYPEEDSASPAVLRRVINEVKEMYQARSYGFLIFSHATGWLPKGKLEYPTRTIGMDGSSEMDLSDFAQAIPDRAFDFIVFETCFMAGIEVAYELKDKTNYILASSAEIVSPGFVSPYMTALTHLLNGELNSFGQAAFNFYNQQTGWMKSATFSLIKTAAIDELTSFIRSTANYNTEIDVADIQRFNRHAHRLFFDFEDYFSRLMPTQALMQELTAKINACVLWKAATPTFLTGYNGFDIAKHSGLTAYIPQEGFPGLNTSYEGLGWTRASRQ